MSGAHDTDGVSAEDVEFVKGNASFAKSLVASRIENGSARAGRKRRREEAADSAGVRESARVPAYESVARPLKGEWLDDRGSRLPLKLADGSMALPKARPVPAGGAAARARAREDAEAAAAAEEDAEGEPELGDAADADVDEDDGMALMMTSTDDIASYEQWRALPLKRRRERRAQLKLQIAEYAEKIVADPEHHIMTVKPEKPRSGQRSAVRPPKRENSLLLLQQLCGDADPVVRRLAMLSCVAVLKDIVPGYRIKEEDGAASGAAGSAAQRVKKDLRKLRSFESALLRSYQRFLKYCEATAARGEAAAAGRTAPGSELSPEAAARAAEVAEAAVAGASSGAERLPEHEWRQQKMAARRARLAANAALQRYNADTATVQLLGHTAVKCMCELLQALPHFNFRANLIGFIIPRLSSKDDVVAAACVGAVGALFAADTSGDACLEVVRALNHYIKECGKRRGGLHAISADAISVLTKLKLAAHLERVKTSRESELRGSRKGSKAKKGRMAGNPFDENDVLSGLRAADAEALEERKQQATSALHGVITICFRLLRTDHGHHLLAPTLRVLARIAHLIDVDVTSDVLAALKDLLTFSTDRVFTHRDVEGATEDVTVWAPGAQQASGTKLSVEAALNCAVTALRIMTGPGELLNADDTPFATFLYASLLRLLEPDEYVHAVLATDAVRALLLNRPASAQRVAAFTRRCTLLAAHMPTSAAMALLSCARSLLAKHPGAASVLDAPDERAHAGFGASGGAPSDLATASRASIFDADRSSAWRSTAWELVALENHYHPAVRTMAANACKRVPLPASDTPERMYDTFNEGNGGFQPPVPAPRPRPATSSAHRTRAQHAAWWLALVGEDAVRAATASADLSPDVHSAFNADYRVRFVRRVARTRRVLLHLMLLQSQWMMGLPLGKLGELSGSGSRGTGEEEGSDDEDEDENEDSEEDEDEDSEVDEDEDSEENEDEDSDEDEDEDEDSEE